IHEGFEGFSDYVIFLSVDLIKELESYLVSQHLVASLEKALENLSEEEWNAIRKLERNYIHGGTSSLSGKDEDPLGNFEEKCTPNGCNAAILYMTTLRGIMKKIKKCNNVRDYVETYGVSINERNVSMHQQFRNELKKLMGKLVIVLRLFIKSMYIGGVNKVLRIHKEGKLGLLLRGIPTHIAGNIWYGCRGVRFVPCLECSGSYKLDNIDGPWLYRPQPMPRQFPNGF
ncbi:hypothetical protein KI387_032773, partial [Taxus chinensis]